MEMKNVTLDKFTAETASKAAIPGGGSVAALSGALAASLAGMVASLTVGKKGYEQHNESMEKLFERADSLRKKLLADIDRDCECFNGYIKVLSLPKENDEQKAKRSQAMQLALKNSAEAPLDAARSALEVMPLAKEAVLNGNKNAVTDGLIAAMMARTAVLSALLNVKINLGSIKDIEYVEKIAKEVATLEAKAIEFEREILELGGF